jgi:GT2 family glycosyltransferase
MMHCKMSQELLKSRRTTARVNILPTLVLYDLKLDSSTTYQTFIVSSRHGGLNETAIAVYDNSSVRQLSVAEETSLCAYEHDPKNGGIAAAYNWALEMATTRGISWLLLLDQDSTLPMEFLESLAFQIRQHEQDDKVVAVVPVVKCGSAVISPMKVGFSCLKPLHQSSHGIQNAEIMAINSGTAIRCSFLRSIGGFNRAYRLDYLDHWLFQRIYASGKRSVVSDCVLEHKLSVQDYRKDVSTARYRSILAGEMGFITTYKPKAEIPIYLLRLITRAIRMLILGRPGIAMLTVGMVFNLIMHPTHSFEGSPE